MYDSLQSFFHTDRRVFHDGYELEAEMLFAAQADPDAASLNERVPLRVTARASDTAIRPADRNHATERRIWIREVNNCLLKCFGECLFHGEESIPQMAV